MNTSCGLLPERREPLNRHSPTPRAALPAPPFPLTGGGGSQGRRSKKPFTAPLPGPPGRAKACPPGPGSPARRQASPPNRSPRTGEGLSPPPAQNHPTPPAGLTALKPLRLALTLGFSEAFAPALGGMSSFGLSFGGARSHVLCKPER